MTSNPFIVQADEVTIKHNGDMYTLTDLNPYCVTVSAIDEQGERCELTLPIVDIIKAAQAEAEHQQRCENELSEANWEDDQLTSYDVTVEWMDRKTYTLTVKANSDNEARRIAKKYLDDYGVEEGNFAKSGGGVYNCNETGFREDTFRCSYEIVDVVIDDEGN